MPERRQSRRGLTDAVLLTAAMMMGASALHATSAVTVAQAREVCMAALAEGFVGEAAARCEWYARPCGACGVGVTPRFCLPSGVGRATVVREVLSDWATGPADAPAIRAAETALARRYPCAATP